MSESTAKYSGGINYVTFPETSTASIKTYLDNGGVRIRVVPHSDGSQWKITVLDAAGQPMGWENDSFPCPPACL